MPKPTNTRAPIASDVAHLIAPFAVPLAATKKPAVQVELSPLDDDDATISKLGGYAYMPAGAAYPTGSDGKALVLLAQIRFEEMPRMEGYPTVGMLQFFIGETEFYGANFDGDFSPEVLSVQKDFRVVFHENIVNPVTTKSVAESTLLPHQPSAPMRMQFSAAHEVMSSSDFRFNKLTGGSYLKTVESYAEANGVDIDRLWDAIGEQQHNGRGHKIGGYAMFTQEDPRTTLGLELLFQLDTDDENIMWGDAGVGGFFISAEDLKRKDFSRVMYNWDCY